MSEVKSAQRKRELRADVRSLLSTLDIEHIEWLATKALEKWPDLEPRLTIHRTLTIPELDMPESLDEKSLWPLVLRRQALVALQGGARDAIESATFIAKVFGKIADTKKKTSAHAADESTKSEQERLRDLADMASLLNHEPGEATIVDSGVRVS